jgi:hypothetical protein
MRSWQETRLIVAGFAAVFGFLLLVACSGGDDSQDKTGSTETATQSGGSARGTVTPTPTVDDEILAGYMDYVEAYKRALLDLDARHVEGFAAGAELDNVRREVEELRSRGVALRLVLTHKPVVVERSATTAVVLDEMVNNSFQVDAKTKEPPVASGSGEILRNSFRLEMIGNRWVVTQVFRNQ